MGGIAFEKVISFLFIFLVQTAPLWLPIILAIVFWQLWIAFIQKENIASREWTTLFVKVPREIHKHPGAMELLLNVFYQTGGVGSWYERWYRGNVRSWFSLEIVSIEGSIYFFIHTEKKFRDVIIPQIYAQYPNVEVSEVEDYTRHIEKYETENDWKIWGTEMVLTKDDGIPIKTYIDYGMDKELLAKDEQKTDPMTILIEHLGSLGLHEQIWIQILITPATKRYKDPTKLFGRRDWVAETKDVIEKFKKDNATGEEGKGPLSKSKNDALVAMERSINKLGFDTGIRCLYLAKGDAFRVSSLVGLIGAFRQYSYGDLNGFKPTNVTDFDRWDDFLGKKLEISKKELFRLYIQREYFHSPQNSAIGFIRRPFILNTEELATIYHFPGGVSETPTLERIQSKKAEPPPDLPL